MSSDHLTTMRLDNELKSRASDIFSELGLSMTSAVRIYLKAVVRTGGIPFDLRLADEDHRGAPLDFTAEYLSPLMSSRNEINRVGFSVEKFRTRLEKRRELISQGRREVV